MKTSLIDKFLEREESLHIEFKSGRASFESISKVVCSFLNADGGEIIIGLNESGIITGVSNGENYKQPLEKKLSEVMSPPSIW